MEKYLLENQILIHKEASKLVDTLLNQLSFSRQEFKKKFQVENYSVIACKDNSNCVRSNLLKFGDELNSKIPSFVNYKIKLNNKIIHVNTKLNNYESEKYYYINQHNQFSIALSLNKAFWLNKQKAIRKVYWFIFGVVSIMCIIMSYFYKLCINNFIVEYKKDSMQEVIDSRLELTKKLWNIEYVNKKDKELNLLFSKYVSLMSSEGNINIDVPCSMVLDSNKERQNSKIDAKKLGQLFKDRFSDSEDNIAFVIKCYKDYIYFYSEIFLYQIIYSILNYLIFAVKFYQIQDSKICVDIGQDNQLVSFNIQTKFLELDAELVDNIFIERNSNPFILSLKKLFTIFKTGNYNLEFYKKKNKIVFCQKSHVTMNNVVTIDSKRK